MRGSRRMVPLARLQSCARRARLLSPFPKPWSPFSSSSDGPDAPGDPDAQPNGHGRGRGRGALPKGYRQPADAFEFRLRERKGEALAGMGRGAASGKLAERVGLMPMADDGIGEAGRSQVAGGAPGPRDDRVRRYGEGGESGAAAGDAGAPSGLRAAPDEDAQLRTHVHGDQGADREDPMLSASKVQGREQGGETSAEGIVPMEATQRREVAESVAFGEAKAEKKAWADGLTPGAKSHAGGAKPEETAWADELTPRAKSHAESDWMAELYPRPPVKQWGTRDQASESQDQVKKPGVVLQERASPDLEPLVRDVEAVPPTVGTTVSPQHRAEEQHVVTTLPSSDGMQAVTMEGSTLERLTTGTGTGEVATAAHVEDKAKKAAELKEDVATPEPHALASAGERPEGEQAAESAMDSFMARHEGKVGPSDEASGLADVHVGKEGQDGKSAIDRFLARAAERARSQVRRSVVADAGVVDTDEGGEIRESLMERLGWRADAMAPTEAPDVAEPVKSVPRSELAERLGWIEATQEEIPWEEEDGRRPARQSMDWRHGTGRGYTWSPYKKERESPEERRQRGVRGGRRRGPGPGMEAREEGVEGEPPSRRPGRRDEDEEEEIVPPDYPPHNPAEYYVPNALEAAGLELGQHDYMDLERMFQLALEPQHSINFGPPVHWSRLTNRISPEQYLEANKHKVVEVMKVQGMELTEETWKEVKEKSIKDFQEWEKQMDMEKLMAGDSLFGNVKVCAVLDSVTEWKQQCLQL
eukprot:evm.model.scf_64.13 EVM.evm.TU.scf_64.13   scf_64:117787-123428(-)